MCSRLPRALAWVLLAASCLPPLDRSRIEVLCQGGVPDGFVQGGEQCDDGNGDSGDGCDDACRLECAPPAALDPLTGRCYLRVDGATSTDDAAAACRTQQAAPVTLRSADELQRVAALLAGAPGPLLTAYRLDTTTLQAPGQPAPVQLRAAVPWPPLLFGEPGILYAASLPSAPACGGCFGGAGPDGDWWREGADLRLALVAGASGGRLAVIDPSQPGSFAGVVCERPRPGSLPNPCPTGCPPGAYAQVRIGSSDYVAFPSSAVDLGGARSREAAQLTCRQLGGALWTLADEPEGEREREAVARALALTTRGADAFMWIGLRATAGVWAWDDAEPPRPSPAPPWALTPDEATTAATGCAALVTRGGSHALGLLLPLPCSLADSDSPAGFVCEIPAP